MSDRLGFTTIVLKPAGSSTTWNGPTETVRVTLKPQPPESFPDEEWTLEIRGPHGSRAGFAGAEMTIVNAIVPVGEASDVTL